MKSRYKKHLKRIAARTPIVTFSQNETANKGEVIDKAILDNYFDKFTGYIAEQWQLEEMRYEDIKKGFYSDVLLFMNNYLTCGNNDYIYLLIPTSKNKYKVIEKEHVPTWQRIYWEKEDPNDDRSWCYFDEDTYDLWEYMINQLDKHVEAF
ncbi:hypothetical protein BEH_07610 [Priestia filamentosa]|uniref:Uncharacterized protein n=1 Tax=Priestia filamentosa TaxID=1402861 RepID=A0A0H4KGP0_9BACI|nr:hypothetical protein [Priestia filamentosa]AKO91976.1 hypothetical protein BEH_07610 [Priestia filamentosa]